jgi:transposase
MRPFPDERSVLVLDNCRKQHNDALVDLVQSAGMPSRSHYQCLLTTFIGCLIIYLPAYSPDLNPIEESFIARKLSQLHLQPELIQNSEIIPSSTQPLSTSRV